MTEDRIQRELALVAAAIIFGGLFSWGIDLMRQGSLGFEFRRDGEVVTLAIVIVVYGALRLVRYAVTAPSPERAQASSDRDATRT